jgi:replicative DNA helicase
LDADKRAGYVAILDRIFNDKAIKDIHTDYVRRNLTGWLRSNLFVSYTKKSVAIYNTGNHDNAYQITKDMLDELVVSDVQDEHTADFSDVEGLLERAKQSVVNAIPMGIPQFEQEMGGGLQPQTLTIVLGGTNVGKTTFCVSLAYYAVQAKKRVCMVVLEDEEEPTKIKFLSRFANIPMNKLYGGYAVLSDEEKARLKKMSKVIEKFITLRFQYGVDMDVESLIDYVSQKHKGETPFDLVIIDYGQILSSKRKADGAYELQKYVHRALKQMANTLGVAVVTPAQGNRNAQKISASGADYLKVVDFADCFELARVANNVITINRSDKDQKSDRIVFYLAKQRRGRVNIAVESVSDYATQLTHRADRCFELNAIESLNDKIPEDEVSTDALPKLED